MTAGSNKVWNQLMKPQGPGRRGVGAVLRSGRSSAPENRAAGARKGQKSGGQCLALRTGSRGALRPAPPLLTTMRRR